MLDRAGAKAAASNKEAKDPELSARIEVAVALETKLAEYQHVQATLTQELGWMGRFLGGSKSAPIAVASIALVLSVLIFLGLHGIVAFGNLDADRIKIIVGAADKCLALATLALGYVCGKSS